ncbi:unnamed protein product [Camellia sinensis]
MFLGVLGVDNHLNILNLPRDLCHVRPLFWRLFTAPYRNLQKPQHRVGRAPLHGDLNVEDLSRPFLPDGTMDPAAEVNAVDSGRRGVGGDATGDHALGGDGEGDEGGEGVVGDEDEVVVEEDIGGFEVAVWGEDGGGGGGGFGWVEVEVVHGSCHCAGY